MDNSNAFALSRYGVNPATAGRLPTVLPSPLEMGLHRYKPDFFPTLPSGLAIQLPDKELRYLRTVIVTADIHQGLHNASMHLAAHTDRA